jgi:NAD(P)-dependent dehydrogenase (short-subunit alcohol dehydrogenase family)
MEREISRTVADLGGKVALVTGGSRGLGKAMALGLAESGAHVAIVSRRLEACEALAENLRALGVRAKGYACHVGRWDGLAALVESVWADFGRIDILINNAGMSPHYASLEDVSEAYFDSVIGVNFKGPFRLCALIGARMHRGDGGSIINISSVASQEGSPGALPYAAAKAALNNLTMGFAAAYGPNVRVNTICVGAFQTDVSKHWQDPVDELRPGWTKAGIRVGRPEEIVGTALYLASNLSSSFTSGAMITVHGGRIRRP